LGIVLFILGFPDQGSARSSGAIAEARALAHAPSLALSLGIGAIMLALAGDNAALNERADQLIAVASEHGFAIWRGHGTLRHGSDHCRRATCQVLGTACCHQSRAAALPTGSSRRGPRYSGPRLRLVHRRFRDTGPEERTGIA